MSDKKRELCEGIKGRGDEGEAARGRGTGGNYVKWRVGEGRQLNSSINTSNNGQQAQAARISRCRHSEAAVQKPPDNVNKTMQTATRSSNNNNISNNNKTNYNNNGRGSSDKTVDELEEPKMQSADRLRLHPLATALETPPKGSQRGCKSRRASEGGGVGMCRSGRGKACGFDLMCIVGSEDKRQRQPVAGCTPSRR